jgi:MFS family permease
VSGLRPVAPGRWPRLLPEPGPVRTLALATLINTAGRGIFFTLSALYFTRILGFSVVSVGVGLSVAAIFGVLAGIPMGHLGDRRGPREVLVALTALETVFSALLLLVDSYWQFVLIASVVTFLDRGAGAVRAGLIGGVVKGASRARTRAYLRSVTNIGITLGSAIAAVALHFDSRAAYVSVLYIDVATYGICALLQLRLPRVEPAHRDDTASMFAATKDVPFVVVTLVVSVLNMHYWIGEIAMPLWVVNDTAAPRWLVSVLLILNTVTVVIFQVFVASRIGTIKAAVRATVVSGVLFVAACAVFGASGSATVVGATVLLVIAASLHVTGEIFQASASFVFGYDFAPDHAQGQYQGLYGMGFAVSGMLAPTVIALLPLRMGVPGWWILAGILLAAAIATVPAAAWATRSRERYGVSMEPIPTGE